MEPQPDGFHFASCFTAVCTHVLLFVLLYRLFHALRLRESNVAMMGQQERSIWQCSPLPIAKFNSVPTVPAIQYLNMCTCRV